MGKCFSCCQSSGEADAGSCERGLGRKEQQELLQVYGGDGNQEIRTPITLVDQQINGNGKIKPPHQALDAVSRPEKRMFYPRIPPLGRTGSGEGKKGFREPSESKINALFEQYRDPREDSMLAEGIERFCTDLEVKPDDLRVLVLAWKFAAEQMCRFTRREFVEGCKGLKVDSLKSIQMRFPEMLSEVQDVDKFKELYRFTFRFGLDSEAGQRILPVDMAICLWRLVFSQREPAVLGRWLDFLEKHPHVRGIPRDTWNMFLNFVEAVGDDLSSYDDAEAWPSLFDDFVEYENDQMNQNISKARDEYKEESE